MTNALLDKVTDKHLREKLPEYRPGDTIRVHVRIREVEKERLQIFEGVVIARNNRGGISETIALLWAALVHDDPELTQERTGQILASKPLDEVVGKLSESIDRYFPCPKEDTEASSPDPTSSRTVEPTG